MRTALFTFVAAAISQAFAQNIDDIISIGPEIEYDAIHNRSSLVGTWSTGSRAVQTGPVRLQASKKASVFLLTFFAIFLGLLQPRRVDLHISCGRRHELFLVRQVTTQKS